MVKADERLTALKVEKEKKPGMHADGNGLYLRVTSEGSKNWVLRFMLNRKARSMGLGPVSLYSLKEARELAREARKLKHQGTDPIEARRSKSMQERLEAAKAITFSECAAKFIKSHRSGWRNAKHAAQWESTLATYAAPVIGSLPVQIIDTALVMRILEQDVDGASLWTARPETAARLRGRLEAILDWAKVRGYRDGDNPARWRGHLDKLLPKRSKVRKVEHHAALPYDEMPGFVTALTAQEGVAARALAFAIFCASRTGEVLGATWQEIDFRERVWTVPGTRMKSGKAHRAALSEQAIAVLEGMRANRERSDAKAFIFPGARHGRPLSNMAFLMLMRRMGCTDLTAHGFRASFKTWAGEETSFPRDVIERALAHVIGNKAEQAYDRGDLFQKRRGLMEAWELFCTSPAEPGNVIELRRAAV